MPRLTLTEASGRTREIPLSSERIAIGRHSDNDVVLNDKAVSGRHAVVITLGTDSFLEDLNSTNGTLVNGRQAARHPLVDGDTISIGRNTLRFFVSELPPAEPEAPSEAAAPKPVDPIPAIEEGPLSLAIEPFASAPASPPITPARLRVQSGPAAGKELELVKTLTTFGKAGVQIAGIRRGERDYTLIRIDGARPTVNGSEIDGDSQLLNDGDSIEVGGTHLQFEWR
jgi:pSer/pThr/pTyr-binding forkhead associated (FHA) protein